MLFRAQYILRPSAFRVMSNASQTLHDFLPQAKISQRCSADLKFCTSSSQGTPNWLYFSSTKSQPVHQVENSKRYGKHIPTALVGHNTEVGFCVSRLVACNTTRSQPFGTLGFLFHVVRILWLAHQMNVSISICDEVWLATMFTLEHYFVVLRLKEDKLNISALGLL